jgi:hypothetical protein
MEETQLIPITTTDELRDCALKYFELKQQIQACMERKKEAAKLMSDIDKRLLHYMMNTQTEFMTVQDDKIIYLRKKTKKAAATKDLIFEVLNEHLSSDIAKNQSVTQIIQSVDNKIQDKCREKEKDVFALEAQVKGFVKI